MMEMFLTALGELVQFENLLVLLLATFSGLIIGATPGLTVNMAVALAVPITMHMGLAPSLCLLLALYCSGVYAGSISAILLNAPGTPASAATGLDGYPLAQQGKAGKALKMALFASVIGGLFSIAALVLISEKLAAFALLFGPPARATLLLFALTLVGFLSGGSMVKGLLAGSLGLLISTVGLDPMLAVSRFTFGVPGLEDGFSLLPVLIGLFAISEILLQAQDRMRGTIGFEARGAEDKEKNRLTFEEMRKNLATIFRSSFLGTFVGILPGIGAAVACFLGYGEAKRNSVEPHLFGKGSLEGVAAAEAANNAVTGATLIPLLALSIPGDSVTAILYGALLLQGVTPGPLIFQMKLAVVYQVYLTLLLANVFMVPVALASLSFMKQITRVRARILFPTVFIFCVLGAWSIRSSLFDVYAMMGFGMLGFVLRRTAVPLAPLLIAFILGAPFEQALRQALVASEGNPMIFIYKPLSALFLLLTLFSVTFSIWRREEKELV